MSKKDDRNYSAAENKRRKKQRAQMRLYVISIIVVAAIVCVILVFNVFFNIQTVEVVGSTNYTSDEIFRASGITVGDNMLRENTDLCSENITSSLTYVETAQVKKVYPNTIKITVEASIPFANVRINDGYFLISQGGKILEKLINPKSGIMTINGSEADITLGIGDHLSSIDPKKNDDIYTLLGAFEDVNYQLESVTYIDITDRANVRFEYDGRIMVELGVVTDLDYKLKFAAEILNNQIGSGVFGTLRLLPDSAQFIDEAGLEENDRVFEQNRDAYKQSLAEQENPDDVSSSDGSETSSDGSGEDGGANPSTEAPIDEDPIKNTTME